MGIYNWGGIYGPDSASYATDAELQAAIDAAELGSGVFDYMLAKAQYDPAGAGSVDTTAAVPIAFRPTELTLTFEAPANGIVEYELDTMCRAASTATQLVWCILDGANAVVTQCGYKAMTSATNPMRQRTTFRETGLTPGDTYTRRWGFASGNGVNIVTHYYGGGAGVAGYGASVFKVFRRAV